MFVMLPWATRENSAGTDQSRQKRTSTYTYLYVLTSHFPIMHLDIYKEIQKVFTKSSWDSMF